MIKHLILLQLIGLALWSCEDNEDAPSLIGEWEFISNYRSGGMGSDTLFNKCNTYYSCTLKNANS